jgi:hypothetical protein
MLMGAGQACVIRELALHLGRFGRVASGMAATPRQGMAVVYNIHPSDEGRYHDANIVPGESAAAI